MYLPKMKLKREIQLVDLLSFFTVTLLFLSCTCIEENSSDNYIKEEVKEADLIARVKVTNIEYIILSDSITEYTAFPYYKCDVEILDLVKGRLTTKEGSIYTGLGNGDCGYNFIVGNEYIVFCKLRELTLTNRFYYTDVCSLTRESSSEQRWFWKRVKRAAPASSRRAEK